jgi:hypothetical protein
LIAATGSWRTSSADVIEQAVWLSVRFPLSLRMIEDLLAARGIVVSHASGTSTMKPCGAGRRHSARPAPGLTCASKIRRRAPQFGDK